MNRKKALWIRRSHRYLGIFLGIQFLFWTISGMYFSWTDLDEIHGDHFKRNTIQTTSFDGLLGTEQLGLQNPIQSLELVDIGSEPYYWIDEAMLIHARTGLKRNGITEAEALKVAARYMLPNLEVDRIRYLQQVGPHHEYRGRPLPAYEISYKAPDHLKVYVSEANGAFQTIRHRSWRWFDFLWMTHTMDYQGRDDFNTLLLRFFSLMGLITVASGFVLWGVSSPTLRRLNRRM